MEKPKVKLLGEDGNAFLILGKAARAAKRAGWGEEEITDFLKKAQNGDYDHLLQIVMEHFDVV
jgi:hypothetical protein